MSASAEPEGAPPGTCLLARLSGGDTCTYAIVIKGPARRGSLGQGKYRVEGDVFYLLRFFLTMPSRDTPASSRTEASMAAKPATKVNFD